MWCVTPKARSSHGLFRGTIAEKDPRFFGPEPAAGTAAGLLYDLAVRQRFLQFGNGRVGDLGAPEGELLQVGQPLEMHQARVADLGGWELEEPQVYQPL